MEGKKRTLTKWLYWFVFAVAVILVYKTVDNLGEISIWFKKLFSILIPFVIGILIAYLFYIPARNLEKTYSRIKNKFIKKRARGIAIFTIYIIAMMVIVLIINFIVPTIIESIKDLISNFQTYYNETITVLNNLPEDSFLKNEIIYKLAEQIKNIDIEKYFNFEQLAQYAKGAINIVTSIFDIFVSVIVSVYILLERDQIIRFLKSLTKRLFKERTYNNIVNYFDQTNNIFYIKPIIRWNNCRHNNFYCNANNGSKICNIARIYDRIIQFNTIFWSNNSCNNSSNNYNIYRWI